MSKQSPSNALEALLAEIRKQMPVATGASFTDRGEVFKLVTQQLINDHGPNNEPNAQPEWGVYEAYANPLMDAMPNSMAEAFAALAAQHGVDRTEVKKIHSRNYTDLSPKACQVFTRVVAIKLRLHVVDTLVAGL